MAEAGINMLRQRYELKVIPKIEGAKKFRRPIRAAGPQMKKDLVTKVLGLENDTFDIGNMKYVSKY